MRRLPALVVAASVLAAITACSGSGGSSGCSPDVASGNASDIVDATGDFGTAPEVTFPEPLITTSTESSVLIHGDGAPLQDGQPVILEATILNGTDGSVLQQTDYAKDGGSLFTIGAEVLPALSKGLECQAVGSRVAVVASAEDSSTEESKTEDSIVFVIDVISAYKARADGVDQLAVTGMPSVVTAPDGTPGITLPNEDAPTDYRTSALKLGDGKTIKADDIVVVKYTALNWDSATVTESTWETGAADILNLGDTAVSEGLKKAIEGEKIGSQILAVIPPALAGTAEAPATGTLVYVVDILGTVS